MPSSSTCSSSTDLGVSLRLDKSDDFDPPKNILDGENEVDDGDRLVASYAVASSTEDDDGDGTTIVGLVDVLLPLEGFGVVLPDDVDDNVGRSRTPAGLIDGDEDDWFSLLCVFESTDDVAPLFVTASSSSPSLLL